MSDLFIRAAFNSRVESWATDNSLTFVSENDGEEPITGAYAEVFILPAPTLSRGLDGTHREWRGICQVNVCVPIDTGWGAASGYASSLDAEFPLTTYITQSGLKIWITAPFSAAPSAYRKDTHWCLPVSCSYQAHAFV